MCNIATLEWSVIELSEAEIFERPVVAAQGLIQACSPALPHHYRRLLTPVAQVAERFTGRRDADVPSGDVLVHGTSADAHHELEVAQDRWYGLCPAESETSDIAVRVDPGFLEEARRHAFRRCSLIDLGIFNEDEFVESDHRQTVSIYIWLLSHGIESSLARPLVREALVRGRRKYLVFPRDVTTLPRGSSSMEIPDVPAIYMSTTSLVVGGTAVADIHAGVLSATAIGNGWNVLDNWFDRVASGISGGRVLLVPDQTVTVGAMVDVMRRASRRGVRSMNVVVVRPEVDFPDLGLSTMPMTLVWDDRGGPNPVSGSADSGEREVGPALVSTVSADTVVYWESGREAGRTRRSHQFFGMPTRVGALDCFEGRGPKLCVRPLGSHVDENVENGPKLEKLGGGQVK